MSTITTFIIQHQLIQKIKLQIGDHAVYVQKIDQLFQ